MLQATRLALGLSLFCAPLVAEDTSAPGPLIGAGTKQMLPQGRLLRSECGYNIEYSPGNEPYVEALLTKLKEDESKRPGLMGETGKAAPAILSANYCREHRAELLSEIAHCLGMEKPLPIQEATFDTFLNYYGLQQVGLDITQLMTQLMRETNDYTMWSREELMARLRTGEKIPCFSYDTKSGLINFTVKTSFENQQDKERQESLAQISKATLDHSYNYTVKDGIAHVSARVSFKPGQAIATLKAANWDSSQMQAALRSDWARQHFQKPMVIGNGAGEVLPPDEAAQNAIARWKQPGQAIRTGALERANSALILILLHETIEVGLVDRYLGSADRRWFCDGTANYLSWKIASKLGGQELGQKVYDLKTSLSNAGALQSRIKLAAWPAVENQPEPLSDPKLNEAHYAFATRALFLMHQKGGPDLLAKLLTEIGKNPREKTSIKTVAKAYKSLTGERLEDLLKRAETTPLE